VPDAGSLQTRATITGAFGDARIEVSFTRGRVSYVRGRERWSSSAGDLSHVPRGLRVLLADRSSALLALCDADACALVRARGGAEPSIVAADIPCGLRTAVARADDDEIALAFFHAGTLEAIWLDPAGTLRARRTIAAEALIGRVDGALLPLARWGTRWYAIGPSPALEPPTVDGPSIPYAVCAPDVAVDPDGVVALAEPTGWSSGPALYAEDDYRMSFGRGTSGLCVARAEGVGSGVGTLTPSASGTLSATITTHAGPRTITCGVR